MDTYLDLAEDLIRVTGAPPGVPISKAVRKLIEERNTLFAALRGLTDAIAKDGHARLNYWPQMNAAWIALGDL